jgi:hypothetical protein
MPQACLTTASTHPTASLQTPPSASEVGRAAAARVGTAAGRNRVALGQISRAPGELGMSAAGMSAAGMSAAGRCHVHSTLGGVIHGACCGAGVQLWKRNLALLVPFLIQPRVELLSLQRLGRGEQGAEMLKVRRHLLHSNACCCTSALRQLTSSMLHQAWQWHECLRMDACAVRHTTMDQDAHDACQHVHCSAAMQGCARTSIRLAPPAAPAPTAAPLPSSSSRTTDD